MEELPTLVQKLTERKAGPGAAGQRSAAELASPAAEFPGHTPHHDTSRQLAPECEEFTPLLHRPLGLTMQLALPYAMWAQGPVLNSVPNGHCVFLLFHLKPL